MGKEKAVNLENNQELPASFQTGGSWTDGLDSYVFKEHVSCCSLYAVRQAYMNRTTVQVKGVQREALITHEHKMLLIPSEKQQMVTENCHLTAIQGTQYPRIKIAKASESWLEIQKNKLTASQF